LIATRHSLSASSLLLQNGTIHTVSGPVLTNSALLIRDRKIAALGTIREAADQVIDLHGQHVFPGLIAPVTVLGLIEIDGVRASRDAGASFVVSPACLPEVIETALEVGVEPIPGVLTATELVYAQRTGATGIKVFPAAPAGGPSYIRALRGPFPDVALLPTGGIEPDDVPAYLAAGATCVGLGSTLVGAAPPSTSSDLDAIAARAAVVMGLVRR
jgi:Entner-Doudoroff aldolase